VEVPWDDRAPRQQQHTGATRGVVSPSFLSRSWLFSGLLVGMIVQAIDIMRVDFTFELVDATTGEHFGTIRIPFSIREG
jgi:hypothetical protein